MTREETAAVVGVVRMLWPHSNLGGSPNEVIGIWQSFLESYGSKEVEEAVRQLAADGREFAPPVGLVVKTIAERTLSMPEWDEAWTEIDRLKKYWNPAFPGRETPPLERFSHPAIAAFALPTWREICRGPAPGTDGYGTFYAQLREAWKARAARDERGVALAAVGAQHRPGLQRPDYLKALPGGGETS